MGAARFLTGLTRLVKEEDLSVIVNTGDDIELFGLHISPDIDIVAYTLAGIVDEEKGWGIRGDTFQCLEILKETWLRYMVWLRRQGFGNPYLPNRPLKTRLYAYANYMKSAKVLGLKIKILPMTDDKFETRITTSNGSMHFEEYFVKRQCKDEVLGVEFVGAATAKPSPGVLDAILDAELIVVCPSNPIVSIGTILAVDGVRDALKRTNARVVGVSPIVAGLPIKGPADKMLRGLGLEVSAFGVAKLYSDFLRYLCY